MWKGRERGKEKNTVYICQWVTWTEEWMTKVMSRKGQCYWNFKSAAKCIRFTADASYAFSWHSLHLETQERYKTQTAFKTEDWIKSIANSCILSIVLRRAIIIPWVVQTSEPILLFPLLLVQCFEQCIEYVSSNVLCLLK